MVVKPSTGTPQTQATLTALEEEDANRAIQLADEEFLAKNGYDQHWPPMRVKLAQILTSTQCDVILGSIVVFNMIVVIAETDHNAKHEASPPPWILVSNKLLLVFYTMELCVRLFTFRKHFFKVGTNLLDLTLVSADWVFIPLALVLDGLVPVSFLRIFRLARLARSTKIIELSPELALIVHGLRDTAKTLLWGALMILLMLTVWSILAVEFIHPVNVEFSETTSDYDGCVRCARAYESVWQSNLTLFQFLIAGDSWGLVTIPVIERKPATAMFFVGVHVTVSIGLMNLLLAVIVDRAGAARAGDIAALEAEEEKEAEVLKEKLVLMCTQMDLDKSGTLQLDELVDGYRNNSEFRLTMKAMDIEEQDMHHVFRMLDEDESGTVPYNEFADHIWKMKSTDDHTLLLFIKFGLYEVKVEVDKEITLLKKEVHLLTSSFLKNSDQCASLHDASTHQLSFVDPYDPREETKKDATLPSVPQKNSKLGEALPTMPHNAKYVEPDGMQDDIKALRQLTDELAQMLKQTMQTAMTPMPRYSAPALVDQWPRLPSCCGLQPLDSTKIRACDLPQAPVLGSSPSAICGARQPLDGRGFRST